MASDTRMLRFDIELLKAIGVEHQHKHLDELLQELADNPQVVDALPDHNEPADEQIAAALVRLSRRGRIMLSGAICIGPPMDMTQPAPDLPDYSTARLLN